VRFRGGRTPYLEWHPKGSLPIVIMSPSVKLTEGPDFAFGARWALMQHHPWCERRRFLDMSDTAVKEFFRSWRLGAECPWYIVEQYLSENGRRARGGAGPTSKSTQALGQAAALPEAEYAAKIAELLSREDYSGAAALQRQQALAQGKDAAGGSREASDDDDDDDDDDDEEEEALCENSADEEAKAEADASTRVLKMLYKGNMEEASRLEQVSRQAKVFNRKHGYYRNARCTNVAQEEQSALPAGVLNVNEDSDDEEAYTGEQKEIEIEMDQLREVKHWINQEGWDAAAEGRAISEATGREIELRLDWGEVRRALARGTGGEVVHQTFGHEPSGQTKPLDEAVVHQNYPLTSLAPRNALSPIVS
jgi:hypothetical protein